MKPNVTASEKPAPVITRAAARAGDARIDRRRCARRSGGKRRRNPIESVVTRHFLEQIHLAVHVDATRRHRDVPAVARRRAARSRGSRECGGRRHREWSRRGSAAMRRAPQPHGCVARCARDSGRHRVPAGSPAPIASSSAHARSMAVTGSRGSAPRSNRMLASVFSPSCLAGPPHRQRVEVRALEDDGFRRGRHLRVGATHDAGDGDRPLAVGDDQHVRSQLADLPVERPDPFAGACRSDADLVAARAAPCRTRASAARARAARSW